MDEGERGGSAAVPAMNECTVRFQCGLLREMETFQGESVQHLSSETLLYYVCDMLQFKFPDHPYGDLSRKVLLYRHHEDNSLTPLLEDDPIVDGMIIEIILSENAKQEYDDTVCPHILKVHTYKAPTFCDYCGVVMFGLLKQGLKCDGCDRNYHKRCAYKIPNNCIRVTTEAHTNVLHAVNMSAPIPSRHIKEVWSGRPLLLDRSVQGRLQVPHTFFVHSFRKPTSCNHCKKLIKGVYHNGMRCKDCKYNCHKKCAKDVGKNCPGEVAVLNCRDSGEWSNSRLSVLNVDESVLDSPNDMRERSETAPPETGERHERTERAMECEKEGSPCSVSSQDLAQNESQLSPSMLAIVEEPSGGEDTTSNDGSEHNPAEQALSNTCITLQRVTGVSMRHIKPPAATVLMEGWMVHYTSKSTLRRKHYWRLDTKTVTLYKTSDSPHYYKEIHLADILAVDPMINPAIYPLSPPHVFEIVTSSLTYYVGVDMAGALPKDLAPPPDSDISGENTLCGAENKSVTDLEDWGVGLNIALNWEEALHTALMPVTPQASMGSLADVGTPSRPPSFRGKRGSFRGSFHGARPGGSFRTPRGSTRGSFRAIKHSAGPPPSRATSSQMMKAPKIETKMDINQFYQIFPEEVLGSGQFGTVYAGQCRTTGNVVAVKVIDKLRFPHKQDASLRQEAAILQNLNYPGIILLERMFENPEKIHIVMEKMNGDMLEMILNSPGSRLTERVTRFLTYQILTALQYLNKKDIVHCDLKPENVLLTSESGMPQAKLCDFGFARIIGDKSFRKSIVGTPAYLAPEVLKSEGYNRSIDLWSVGVIIYVSLSGTFPFNEDEDIADQIQNAAFMYPPDPWDSISKDAIELVGKLLQVSRRSRVKTNQAINHIWLRDLTLWEDLCQLEGRLGTRYLTHESEDAFWRRQGAMPHPLDKPQQALAPPPTTNYYVNIHTIHETIAAATNSSDLDSSTSSLDQQIPISVASSTTASNSQSSDKDESTSEDIASKRKSYVALPDEDVTILHEHAKRIGYTVSTV